jgi:hypothetical protein
MKSSCHSLISTVKEYAGIKNQNPKARTDSNIANKPGFIPPNHALKATAQKNNVPAAAVRYLPRSNAIANVPAIDKTAIRYLKKGKVMARCIFIGSITIYQVG